ncbi:hypothetical protein GNI_102710 [Gregarina niphandrodes]|uniref:Uncharacterized protein n=1 Tax=Gregarina niphandrodes TaxID=110365 RepID=A0A023B4B0_GRENI|nr:hypothetical protein GNI_102710 [Gregarina niphandrodes]EZG56589.1 hypothetical protein GNI_102710 [Gregarina niphandrodes]|eukprot:XP_011131224.1 hypothetical protein GNI_102710 [Gregarina niphandrodes]
MSCLMDGPPPDMGGVIEEQERPGPSTSRRSSAKLEEKETTTTTGSSLATPPRVDAGDELGEFVPWMERQVAGECENQPSCNQLPGSNQGVPGSNLPGQTAWWCYCCSSRVADGPPGDHFCYNRLDDGGVICNYCGKVTNRMPDLRVHFRKIVYCRRVRKIVKRHYRDYRKQLVATAEATANTEPNLQS